MRKITITKAKIKDGKLELVEFEEQLPDGGVSLVSQSCTANIHPDMVSTFAKLNIHLASICEQRDSNGSFAVDKVSCTTFSLRGDDEKAGVVLSGSRGVAANRSFAINTPFLTWEKGELIYPEIHKLEEDIEACTEEVKAYLLENKHAEDPQGKLFTNDRQHIDETLPVSRCLEITEHAAIIIAQSAQGDATMKWLDPAAHNGRLAKNILTGDRGIEIDCYELDQSLHPVLSQIEGVKLLGKEFMECKARARYDRIVSYPPMANGIDIDYIRHMHLMLKSGGRLVTLVSRASVSGDRKKQDDFRKWLDTVGAIITPIENAAFDEKGNEIPCSLIMLNKK